MSPALLWPCKKRSRGGLRKKRRTRHGLCAVHWFTMFACLLTGFLQRWAVEHMQERVRVASDPSIHLLLQASQLRAAYRAKLQSSWRLQLQTGKKKDFSVVFISQKCKDAYLHISHLGSTSGMKPRICLFAAKIEEETITGLNLYVRMWMSKCNNIIPRPDKKIKCSELWEDIHTSELVNCLKLLTLILTLIKIASQPKMHDERFKYLNLVLISWGINSVEVKM